MFSSPTLHWHSPPLLPHHRLTSFLSLLPSAQVSGSAVPPCGHIWYGAVSTDTQRNQSFEKKRFKITSQIIIILINFFNWNWQMSDTYTQLLLKQCHLFIYKNKPMNWTVKNLQKSQWRLQNFSVSRLSPKKTQWHLTIFLYLKNVKGNKYVGCMFPYWRERFWSGSLPCDISKHLALPFTELSPHCRHSTEKRIRIKMMRNLSASRPEVSSLNLSISCSYHKVSPTGLF